MRIDKRELDRWITGNYGEDTQGADMTIAEILNEIGINAERTRYGGHDAAFLPPDVSVLDCCWHLSRNGIEVSINWEYSMPLLIDTALSGEEE